MTAMADFEEQEASVQPSALLLPTGSRSVMKAQAAAEAEETDGAVKDSGSR